MAEILFLGTGAADWEIEERNGFFRRNSAALLDRKIMFDCGCHIFDFAECSGESALYDNVTDILITHNHSDHYSAESVRKVAENKKINVICSEAVKAEIGEAANINYMIFKPFEKLDVSGYGVTPVLANHDIVMNDNDASVHYIIETPDGKTLFYGLDGAWFLRPSWECMKQYKFDMMVLDCTVGDMDDWRIFEHNTIPMLRFLMKEIANAKMVRDGGVVIASHLARTLHTSHEETEKVLDEIGMATAFDGMKIEF